MSNGGKLASYDLAELATDTRDLGDHAVSSFNFRVTDGFHANRSVLWADAPRPNASATMILESDGSDRSNVFAVHGLLKHEIEKHFADLDAKEAAVPAAAESVAPTLSIGSISGHTVAVSNTGAATATSAEPPSLARRVDHSFWDRPLWVTLLAPLFVGVAAGAVIYLLTK